MLKTKDYVPAHVDLEIPLLPREQRDFTYPPYQETGTLLDYDHYIKEEYGIITEPAKKVESYYKSLDGYRDLLNLRTYDPAYNGQEVYEEFVFFEFPRFSFFAYLAQHLPQKVIAQSLRYYLCCNFKVNRDNGIRWVVREPENHIDLGGQKLHEAIIKFLEEYYDWVASHFDIVTQHGLRFVVRNTTEAQVHKLLRKHYRDFEHRVYLIPSYHQVEGVYSTFEAEGGQHDSSDPDHRAFIEARRLTKNHFFKRKLNALIE